MTRARAATLLALALGAGGAVACFPSFDFGGASDGGPGALADGSSDAGDATLSDARADGSDAASASDADASAADAPADLDAPFDGAIVGCDMSGLEPGAPYPMSGYCPAHRYQSPLRGPKAMPSLAWRATSAGDITAEPIVSRDGTIYVGSSSSNLYALAPDGGSRWTFTVPFDAGPDAAGAPIAGSVAIDHASLVWVLARAPALTLFALDPGDGGVVRALSVSDSESALAIGPDGTIYYVGVGADLDWITTDGNTNQAYPSNGADFSLPAVGEDGTMFVATVAGIVCAIAPDAGTIWSTQLDAGAGGVLASAAIAPDGTLRMATSAISAFTADGGALWSTPTPAGAPQGIAVDGDGRTVVAEQGAAPFTVSAAGDASARAPGPFSGCTQPVVDADGWTYLACAGSIYAFDASFAKVWTYAYQGALNGAPVVGADGTLYFTVDAYTSAPLTSAVYAIR